jgi:hypothetical protein
VADVDHDEEWRAGFFAGEGAGVLFGLATGAEEDVVPGGGAARAVTAEAAFFALAGGVGKELFFVLLLDALLGFEDEAAALVEVDAAEGLGAVRVDEHDAAFEDVGIGIVFLLRGLGAGDFEQIAELAEKEGVVGAFGAARGGPAIDEGLDGVAGHAALSQTGAKSLLTAV